MREYEKLDTSNIYADVKNPYADIETEFENVYEDMTVNQQQAQFEKQMAQQQQANIMQQMSSAAGGSGIASLAQAMANQGQLQAQRAGASIGMQESQNQRLTAQGAQQARSMEQQALRTRMAGEGRAQMQRLRGEEQSRGLEYQKTGTLLGMSQQRLAAANEARRQAKAQQMSAVGDIAGAGLDLAKAATDFGETNSNGVWIPKDYDGSYGTNGYRLEFQQTGTSQNATGIGADTSGQGNHLAVTNLAATDVTTDSPTNNFATLNPLNAPPNKATFSEGNLKSVTPATGNQGGLATQGVSTGKWYAEFRLHSKLLADKV